MEQTLKITNVLSDPTRYYIYQYITKRHQEVTVQEVAENFNIHPNVARLHLSKLEDVNMLASETKRLEKAAGQAGYTVYQTMSFNYISLSGIICCFLK